MQEERCKVKVEWLFSLSDVSVNTGHGCFLQRRHKDTAERDSRHIVKIRTRGAVNFYISELAFNEKVDADITFRMIQKFTRQIHTENTCTERHETNQKLCMSEGNSFSL